MEVPWTGDAHAPRLDQGHHEAFYAEVRTRQRARLLAYANPTLLADWMLADRWLQLKEEEGRLRADLARLVRRGPES